MRKNLIILTILPLLTLNGCFGISNEFRNVKRNLAQESDIKRIKKNVEFSLGRGSLYLLEKLTGYVDRDLLAEMTIHDISKFEIGVYEIRGYKDQNERQQSFESNQEKNGWIKFIKTKDGEDVTHIYVKVNKENDKINEIVIETIDSENIILIRSEGNFNRIVQRLIKARKFALK